MKIKKVVILCTAGLLLCSVLSAQTVKKAKSETTVENEYMANIEALVITELANSDSYDNKLVAIKEIEKIVNEGRATPAITTALDNLAREGTLTQQRTNGRVTNNYPDIRRQACDLLGQIKTEESKNALVTVALNDNEPTVAAAAIRALGEVGLNNNNEVVSSIAWTQKRTAVLNPTSSLAFEVIEAYEKLASTTDDKGPIIESLTQIASNTRYVTTVRTKALALLKRIQGAEGN